MAVEAVPMRIEKRTNVLKNVRRLIRLVMRLSVWEPHWLSERERLGRMRANRRRKMKMRRISGELRMAFAQRARLAA